MKHISTERGVDVGAEIVGDDLTIATREDITALVDRNKRLREGNDGMSPNREFKRVASFPASARPLFIQMFGADPFLPENEALLNRILNDPDLVKFRTSEGRI